MMFELNKRLGRWKTDLILAGQYLSPFMTFMTLASLLYTANLLGLKTIFQHYAVFFGVSILVFLILFKLGAKLIIRLKLYSAERIYQAEINPLEVDKANLKEKNYLIPLTLSSTDLSLLLYMPLMLLFDESLKDNPEWIKIKPKLIECLADLKAKRDKYQELLDK